MAYAAVAGSTKITSFYVTVFSSQLMEMFPISRRTVVICDETAAHAETVSARDETAAHAETVSARDENCLSVRLPPGE